MEHTGDRLRVSPRGEIWFAFHAGVNISHNPNFFSHRGEFHPTRCNRGLTRELLEEKRGLVDTQKLEERFLDS